MAPRCQITNLETNISTITSTNQEGIYVIPDLRPATYRADHLKRGLPHSRPARLRLYAQDSINENFKLALAPVSEISTVTAPLLQTDSAAVSTVVDQQVAQDMELNGRSSSL